MSGSSSYGTTRALPAYAGNPHIIHVLCTGWHLQREENPAQPKPEGRSARLEQFQAFFCIMSSSLVMGRVERTLYRSLLRLARSFDKEPVLKVGSWT